jgi:hypothetical protein
MEGQGSLVNEARRKELAWKQDIQTLWRSANVDTFLHNVMSWGTCTTQLAEQMRETTWGFKVHAATIPCPVEQVALSPWHSTTAELKSGLLSYLPHNSIGHLEIKSEGF